MNSSLCLLTKATAARWGTGCGCQGTVETAGRALGNQQMEAEGQAGQAKGNLKQAGEKAKDAFKK
jgi:hypothetical protein